MKDVVKDWMTSQVITVEPTKTVKEAVAIMDAHQIGALVVVENKMPVGIFTYRDIIRQIIAMDLNPSKVEVGTFVKPNPIIAKETMTSAELGRIMSLNELKRLPIVNDNGELTGIVSRSDLLKHLAKLSLLE